MLEKISNNLAPYFREGLDALHEAAAAGTAFVLPPGASYQWRLSVTLN
jgi:hypothetical protein